jgi:hypothetical protein
MLAARAATKPIRFPRAASAWVTRGVTEASGIDTVLAVELVDVTFACDDVPIAFVPEDFEPPAGLTA